MPAAFNHLARRRDRNALRLSYFGGGFFTFIIFHSKVLVLSALKLVLVGQIELLKVSPNDGDEQVERRQSFVTLRCLELKTNEKEVELRRGSGVL